MVSELFFLWKNKILKDPANLSYHTERFFHLSSREQKKVIDKYFRQFYRVEGLENYFDSKESRYFSDGREVTFFHSYYFDYKLLEYRIDTIRLIDSFVLDFGKKEELIHYALERLSSGSVSVTALELIHYPDELPKALSENLEFMRYLVEQDESNIKYITFCDEIANRQRELIHDGIEKAKNKPFILKKFLKNNGELPKILRSHFDFLVYLIENDIENICYLDEDVFANTTLSNRKLIVQAVIRALSKKPTYLEKIENHSDVAYLLNSDEDFISYMVSSNIDFIRYINFQQINGTKREKIIHQITDLIIDKNIDFDIMKYSCRNLFFQNAYFMKYLISKDFRWIAVNRVDSNEEQRKLVDLFFDKISKKKYRFKLENFLEDGEYFNHRLVEDERMLHYFFSCGVKVVQHINFFDLNNSRSVVDSIMKEIEDKNYEFCNDDFLVNGKYPIPLSNSYQFMRYVIDKNFNHLAFMDISMIHKDELKRIINYAFRMVYYIRGNNRNLSFDIDGYFKGTDIFLNDYFQECLRSL